MREAPLLSHSPLTRPPHSLENRSKWGEGWSFPRLWPQLREPQAAAWVMAEATESDFWTALLPLEGEEDRPRS